MRWKEGKARYTIGENSASSGVLVFFFPNLPRQPLSKPLFCPVCICQFFGVVRELQCSTSLIRVRLRKSSMSCPCYLCLACLTSKYFSCFILLMQASDQTQQDRLSEPVLDGPGSFSSRSAPLHTCTNVFVCHLHMPPHLVPCSVTPHFFVVAIPHLTDPILGCDDGSKPCFRATQGLPCKGTTPLSSSPYPSCTSPKAETDLWATDPKGMMPAPDFGRVLSRDRFKIIVRYRSRGLHTDRENL